MPTGTCDRHGIRGSRSHELLDDTTVVLASDDSEGSVAGPWIANWGEFTWSPAGDVLAVTEGAGGLWLVPTDGGEPRLLREDSFSGSVWSPDGSRIAAAACPGSCEGDVVRILRVDGTAADLDLGPGEQPAWSPTGDRLAYLSTVEVSAGSFEQAVVIADGDGGESRSLPSVPDAGGATWGLASGVHWSPDGRQLLFIGVTDVPTTAYAPVAISLAGDAPPVVLAPPTMDLYATRDTDLSWQPVP